MGDKTKIDWADATWNPVTGCRHGCEYCYARRIAERFSAEGQTLDAPCELQRVWIQDAAGLEPGLHVLRYEVRLQENGRVCPYPFGFTPTFHKYRLDIPKHWTKPRTIFVCSMADLFGDWVPDKWIKDVFDACRKAPQHRYLFLTKNPARYCDLYRAGKLPGGDNYWYGATYDHGEGLGRRHGMENRPVTFTLDGKPVHNAGSWWLPGWFWGDTPELMETGETIRNSFISFEPLLYDIGAHIGSTGGDWLIIGAETGNRKGKPICKREWVDHIVDYARKTGKPVFMKESLRGIMGEDFVQEFPWQQKKEGT